MTDKPEPEAVVAAVDALVALMAGDGTNVLTFADLMCRRPAWHARAACRGKDSALFFPGQGAPGKRAKTICAGCPVRQQCLEAAVTGVELHGIWAGTGPVERRKLRRERRQAA